MPRHHGQTITKSHLQHKQLVIKVINTKPNKKCKRLEIKSIILDTLSSPSDVRDLGKHGLDCQELLRSILDPETTHTLYDGQWMMVVDDGVMVVVGGG